MAGGNSDTDRDETSLFMSVQHWRTARAVARIRHSIEQMNAASWAPEEDIVPDNKKLLISAMRFALRSREMLTDLKIRFVDNRTNRDFIIGDDPAVMLNRFASEKLGGSAFGLISSGLIFVMPMSPRLSVICYDSLVYSLDVTNGRAVLKSEAAVDAYNDIQCLAAEENIYVQQWENGEYVRERFKAVKHKRRPASTAHTYVPDGETDDAEHYRPGTVEEGRVAKRSLVSIQFNFPEPDRWVPGLRYRSNPTTFFNGTGVGYVRKREWLYRGPDEPPPDPGEKMHIIRTKPQPSAWTKQ
jgi:hypothetical protein